MLLSRSKRALRYMYLNRLKTFFKCFIRPTPCVRRLHAFSDQLSVNVSCWLLSHIFAKVVKILYKETRCVVLKYKNRHKILPCRYQSVYRLNRFQTYTFASWHKDNHIGRMFSSECGTFGHHIVGTTCVFCCGAYQNWKYLWSDKQKERFTMHKVAASLN